MLPFETFDDPDSDSGAALRQLPLYIEPKQNEVLLSWLLRLATRLGVSLQTLVQAAFWIDDRRERSQWWRRPEPQMLSRIGAKTGITTERLRGMTLDSWSPVYRDDEADERFSAERFRVQAPKRKGFRHVLCTQCLEADATPYLRICWVMGWVAVCPEHATIMIARCPKCRAKLRPGWPSSIVRFAPPICTQCGNDLRYGLHEPAHPRVIQLQHALLEGKRQGATELAGIGRLSWMEVVAFADVVSGMYWTDTRPAEQQQRHSMLCKEFAISDTQSPASRYTDLAFLAWLTQSWPHGRGPQVAIDMLARWLCNEPNLIFRDLGVNGSAPRDPGPHPMPQHIQERLRQLFDASCGTLARSNP